MKPYLRYTWQLIWRQKLKFLVLVFVVALETAARLVQPYFYKVLVDTLTSGIVAKNFLAEQVKFLLMILGVWFFVAVANNFLNSMGNLSVWQIGNVASQWVHMEGFRKLLRLDYFKHTQKHSSKYAKLVDDADGSMWEMMNWWLGRFFNGAMGFFTMLVVAFTMSWQMTLVSLSVIPFGLGIILFMMSRYENEQREVNKLWNAKHEHLSDQIANIVTYKLNQDEQSFLEVQKGFSDRGYQAQSNLNRKWMVVDLLNPDTIARFLVMGMGVWFVKDGLISLGTLFMFMGLLNEILTPLHLLGDILPQYSRRARHIDRFLTLLQDKDSVVDPKRPVKLKKVFGKIEFRNVSFEYPSGKGKGFGIRNLSFTIEPGEHMAIVGHSGAGKSTIMALMTRLVDPTEGQVLLDGVDLRKLKQEEFHRLLGVVLQEHSLYDETVAQNIAYGKQGATMEEIVAAAKKAAAHDFIVKLPEGYNTITGERGVRLSGGEKQRIAIARGILKNPKVVILDEPTSALDSITEAKVQKGLEVLMKGRTSVTIAHRLSTVREADKILVLENGQMVAFASHEELMKMCEDYREMVKLQTSGFLADAVGNEELVMKN